MSDKPILMRGEMVRAILEGRKSQTRRTGPPRYAVGDRLWVRETIWRTSYYPDTLPCGEPFPQRWCWGGEVHYVADGDPPQPHPRRDASWRKVPSIHMPRWASRITLEVTAVRQERLQDISGPDARAEGFCGTIFGDVWAAFAFYWDSLAAPGSRWSDNPVVTVYDFLRAAK